MIINKLEYEFNYSFDSFPDSNRFIYTPLAPSIFPAISQPEIDYPM